MLAKAFLMRKDDPSSIVRFQFNPNELTVEKTNQFAEKKIPGLPSSTLSFVKGEPRVLTLDLFFDTYEQKIDVRVFTDRITGWDSSSLLKRSPFKGLMEIYSELHAPPVCLFVWGAFIFPCIIERASKKFTMFLPEGIPVRATLNVTLKEYKEHETQLKEIALQSADTTKIWHVKQGDTLWLIAAKEYGNPSLWRRIAEKNKIHNPRLLKPGMELIIQPLEGPE
jgi:hypothetical protein